MDSDKVKVNIISPGEQLTYDEFTERIYTVLLNSYWEELPSQQAPALFTKTILQEYIEFFYPPLTKELIESAKGIADMFSIEWNDKQYVEYIVGIKEDRIMNEAPNIPLLALCNVFRWMLDDLKEAYEKVEAGNFKRVGDYIVVDGMPNEVVAHNERKVEIYRRAFLENLKSVFKERLQSQDVIDKDLFFETEAAEFSRFFKQGESLKGWNYLKKRLSMDDAAVEEVYAHNNDIVLGTFRTYFLKKKNETDLRCIGELFAIRDYLRQIGSIRKELNSEVAQRPELASAAGGGIRIPLLVSAQLTQEYFMELAKEYQGHPQLLKEEDVKYWLSADFEGFGDNTHYKVLALGGKSNSFSKIRYYVYQFWYHFMDAETSDARDAFCQMLVRRFEPTRNIDTLRSHFSDSAKLPSYLLKKIEDSRHWKR